MPRQSLKQVAFDSIKNKILTFEYQPNQFLNEDILCNDLDMSRTPIRDALSRLEQEGLVRIIPKKGFFIAPLTISDINQVYEGRFLIEPYVISTYCGDLSDELIAKLQDIMVRHKAVLDGTDSNGSFYELDNEFHHLLLNQCTNMYFQNTYERMEAQNVRLRVLSGKANSNRLHRTYEEHEKIFKELCNHNAAAAAEAMRVHITNSKDSAFSSILKNSTLI